MIEHGERAHAVQTLADFERDGYGHHLDNADADLLRAMVRESVERRREVVEALIQWRIAFMEFCEGNNPRVLGRVFDATRGIPTPRSRPER